MESSEPAPPSNPPAVLMRAILVVRTPKQKITFIRQIRALGGLGLKEAKDVAELPPPFVLILVAGAIAEHLVSVLSKQLGESGIFEIYDADASMVPAIQRPMTVLANLASGGTGCTAQAAALLFAAGAALYFWF